MTNERAWEIYTKVYGKWSKAPSADEGWNESVADHVRRVCEAETEDQAIAVVKWWYEHDEMAEARRHVRMMRRRAKRGEA